MIHGRSGEPVAFFLPAQERLCLAEDTPGWGDIIGREPDGAINHLRMEPLAGLFNHSLHRSASSRPSRAKEFPTEREYQRIRDRSSEVPDVNQEIIGSDRDALADTAMMGRGAARLTLASEATFVMRCSCSPVAPSSGGTAESVSPS